MKKIARIVIIVGIFALILVALISSSIRPANLGEKIWNENMILGDPETAVRHYVVYTDLMCPYCNYYAKNIYENEEEFKEFLASNKILYEVRVTDTLYEGSGIELSRPAAEGAYCAAKEGKFWDYYHKALDSLFSQYYNKGVGNSKTASPITDMNRDYWLKLGTNIGLGDSFAECFNNKQSVSEIHQNTVSASQIIQGLPYFVFDKFSTSGFDPSWNWKITRQMLEACL